MFNASTSNNNTAAANINNEKDINLIINIRGIMAQAPGSIWSSLKKVQQAIWQIKNAFYSNGRISTPTIKHCIEAIKNPYAPVNLFVGDAKTNKARENISSLDLEWFRTEYWDADELMHKIRSGYCTKRIDTFWYNIICFCVNEMYIDAESYYSARNLFCEFAEEIFTKGERVKEGHRSYYAPSKRKLERRKNKREMAKRIKRPTVDKIIKFIYHKCNFTPYYSSRDVCPWDRYMFGTHPDTLFRVLAWNCLPAFDDVIKHRHVEIKTIKRVVFRILKEVRKTMSNIQYYSFDSIKEEQEKLSRLIQVLKPVSNWNSRGMIQSIKDISKLKIFSIKL